MCDKVFEYVTQYQLCDHLVGMVFDTTSANTGIDNGAATLLQDKLGRKILFFACRHHIYELYLKCAFENLVQKTGKKTKIMNLIINVIYCISVLREKNLKNIIKKDIEKKIYKRRY